MTNGEIVKWCCIVPACFWTVSRKLMTDRNMHVNDSINPPAISHPSKHPAANSIDSFNPILPSPNRKSQYYPRTNTQQCTSSPSFPSSSPSHPQTAASTSTPSTTPTAKVSKRHTTSIPHLSRAISQVPNTQSTHILISCSNHNIIKDPAEPSRFYKRRQDVTSRFTRARIRARMMGVSWLFRRIVRLVGGQRVGLSSIIALGIIARE
jgi:hypothetical protein